MNVRSLAGLSLLLAGLILNTGQGWADTWQHAVSSQVSTEFDTNPALSRTYPGSVWRILFDPSYTLMGRVGANDLRAVFALHMARSSNKTLSPNRDGPSVFLDWLRQNDAGEFGISSRYDEIATRDSGVDSTGLVPLASTRTSRSMSGRWSKALSERSTLSADGAYERVSYKGGNYIDYATRSGGMRFSYALSETGTLFLRATGDRYIPAGVGPSSRHANAELGLNWKVDNMDWTMQAGKSRAGGSSVLFGALAVQYTGQRTQLALNADRHISASGLGGFVKADQMIGHWSYDLSEYSSTGIDLQWLKNHSITVNNIRTNTGVWLQNNLNPLWGVRTYYLHNTIKGGAADNAYSNILGLSLIYNYSDF